MTIHILLRRWIEPIDSYNGKAIIIEDKFIESGVEVIDVEREWEKIRIEFMKEVQKTKEFYNRRHGKWPQFIVEQDDNRLRAVLKHIRDIEVIEVVSFYMPVKISL